MAGGYPTPAGNADWLAREYRKLQVELAEQQRRAQRGVLSEAIYVPGATGYYDMESGWTINNAQITYAGPFVQIRISVKKTAPNLAGVATTGNFVNEHICTLNDASFRPTNTSALSTDNTGPSMAFYIQADGGVYLSAGHPSLGVENGWSLSFSGTYLRFGPSA